VEIHSSSLYIAPSSQPAPSTTQANNPKPESQTTPAYDEVKKATQPSSNDQFADAAQKKQALQLPHLSTANESNTPLDTATKKALTEYKNISSQIPQQQINSTLSGIDFYA